MFEPCEGLEVGADTGFVVGVACHAHEAADVCCLEVAVASTGEEVEEFGGEEAEFCFLFGDVGLDEHAAHYADAQRLAVDEPEQAFAVDALDEAYASRSDECADLVGLQVAYEVPLDILWQSCGLVEELLHAAFAKNALVGVVSLGNSLGGVEFRYRHKVDPCGECRPYGGK